MKSLGFVKKTYKFYLYGLLFSVAIATFGLFFYNFFHVAIEIITIVFYSGIFIFAVNTRRYCNNDFFYFFGIISFFYIFIEFFHIVSMNKSMFPSVDNNMFVQLWITASFIQAVSFLIAPYFINKKLNTKLIFSIFVVISIFFVYIIFETNQFPICLNPNGDITPFKKISELICAVPLFFSYMLIKKHKENFSSPVYLCLMTAIFFLIAAQICFAIYTNITSSLEVLGSIFKIIGFYAIYRAVVVNGLNHSVETLLDKLTTLIREKNALINKLEEEKEAAKILKEILTVCKVCNKRKNDQDYNKLMERYMKTHLFGELSISICELCAESNDPTDLP